VLSLAWILADYWVVGLLNFLFMILHIAALQKPIVSINESQVIYPSFLGRKLIGRVKQFDDKRWITYH
jgi:hypothetical protein